MTSTILIFASILVIASYFFDFLSKYIRLPSVLFLLASGILIQIFWNALGNPNFKTSSLLEVIGTIGLILIVLEGSLELELGQEKRGMIQRSVLVSFSGLLVTSLAIAYFLQLSFNVSFQLAWINAIPLSVISSAIAIPTAKNLPMRDREFITYDSSMSDILGVMLMNYALLGNVGTWSSLVVFGFDAIMIVVIGGIATIILFTMLHYIKFHIKFILIYAVLLLSYGVVKSFHLPALLMVLFFGITLNNYKMLPFAWLQNLIRSDRFDQELVTLKIINQEGAFLIRTFFFLLFGFSLNLQEIQSIQLWESAGIICLIIILFRAASLLSFQKKLFYPAVFIAPRGLISILLFFSIPNTQRIVGFGDSILFAIVIISCIIMIFATVFSKRELKHG